MTGTVNVTGAIDAPSVMFTLGEVENGPPTGSGVIRVIVTVWPETTTLMSFSVAVAE